MLFLTSLHVAGRRLPRSPGKNRTSCTGSITVQELEQPLSSFQKKKEKKKPFHAQRVLLLRLSCMGKSTRWVSNLLEQRISLPSPVWSLRPKPMEDVLYLGAVFGDWFLPARRYYPCPNLAFAHLALARGGQPQADFRTQQVACGMWGRWRGQSPWALSF